MTANPSSDTTLDSTTPNAIASSQPNTSAAAAPEPGFGWTHYAEQINGRFAMVGFISLLLMELFTRQDFFTWVGLR